MRLQALPFMPFELSGIRVTRRKTAGRQYLHAVGPATISTPHGARNTIYGEQIFCYMTEERLST